MTIKGSIFRIHLGRCRVRQSDITFYQTDFAVDNPIATSMSNEFINDFDQCKFDIELVNEIILYHTYLSQDVNERLVSLIMVRLFSMDFTISLYAV